MVNSAEFASKFQEESQKNMERVQAIVDSFVVNPSDPPMALTPREVVWKRGKTRLYRYHSTEREVAYPTPYIIVPWLGISPNPPMDRDGRGEDTGRGRGSNRRGWSGLEFG